jgi:hypothetical protein
MRDLAHFYRSCREYRFACERSGKGTQDIERCVISTFQVAESMGFKRDFREWEHLLRIGDLKIAVRSSSSQRRTSVRSPVWRAALLGDMPLEQVRGSLHIPAKRFNSGFRVELENDPLPLLSVPACR